MCHSSHINTPFDLLPHQHNKPSLNLLFSLKEPPQILPPQKNTHQTILIDTQMSGVWVFNSNGVIRLIENPAAEEGREGSCNRRKVLVHLATGEVVSSYSSLEHILLGLGWERYYGGDTHLYQFHNRTSIDLISLPRDFSKFKSVYMYDIVIKNPNIFHVRDV
ncbi:hypothetical protein CFOL_v3_07196 [Cephalotus follicularis]|uniref:Uncharacterized protein n=1 Tax=Cephalotus follicularis TaxID=3775 RepID=A0A1Q3B6P3_CEPFO|nr:hypothetical protein CFOL_v3_07196 [Cephalotus follicularis]